MQEDSEGSGCGWVTEEGGGEDGEGGGGGTYCVWRRADERRVPGGRDDDTGDEQQHQELVQRWVQQLQDGSCVDDEGQLGLQQQPLHQQHGGGVQRD